MSKERHIMDKENLVVAAVVVGAFFLKYSAQSRR